MKNNIDQDRIVVKTDDGDIFILRNQPKYASESPLSDLEQAALYLFLKAEQIQKERDEYREALEQVKQYFDYPHHEGTKERARKAINKALSKKH